MYKKEDGFPAINSIGIVEGSFQCAPGDYSSVSIELLLVYLHHPSMITFGTCPVKGELLSAETHEKFREFLLSAESDFVNVAKDLLEAQPSTEQTPLAMPEDPPTKARSIRRVGGRKEGRSGST